MTKVKLRSITLLNSKNLKSLLDRVPEPFPQPTLQKINDLGGLVEQVNLKAEALHLTVHQVAAEYFVRICVGHKLVDGNKRSAVILLDAFYSLNEIQVPFSEDRVAKFAVMLASIKTSQMSVEQKVAFMTHELSEI